MTFAKSVKILKQDIQTLIKHCKNKNIPDDFALFIELMKSNRQLITPIPSYATHGETKYLAPFRNWNMV